mmetsp:Transcript_44067/g.47724  ORF Transcript_44067/g.47724 Transcript_44067/m.47724 type:complete len:112 (-) Transcript_44067:803-1138(-)
MQQVHLAMCEQHKEVPPVYELDVLWMPAHVHLNRRNERIGARVKEADTQVPFHWPTSGNEQRQVFWTKDSPMATVHWHRFIVGLVSNYAAHDIKRVDALCNFPKKLEVTMR